MTLQDIFDSLTYGELSQMPIGGMDNVNEFGEACPGIAEKDREQVIAHINAGLQDLYTRFRLKEGKIKVLPLMHKSVYVLNKRFVVTNTASQETFKYLINPEGYELTDDVVRIESLQPVDPAPEDYYYEQGQKRVRNLPLNEIGNPESFRTPSLSTLVFPESWIYKPTTKSHPDYRKPQRQLIVNYQAAHTKIDPRIGKYGAMAIPLELPQSHMKALLYFVASSLTNPVGLENEFHTGNSYFAKYDGECKRLANKGLEIDHVAQTSCFEDQGFV